MQMAVIVSILCMDAGGSKQGYQQEAAQGMTTHRLFGMVRLNVAGRPFNCILRAIHKVGLVRWLGVLVGPIGSCKGTAEQRTTEDCPCSA